jgi:hypothetical protein
METEEELSPILFKNFVIVENYFKEEKKINEIILNEDYFKKNIVSKEKIEIEDKKFLNRKSIEISKLDKYGKNSFFIFQRNGVIKNFSIKILESL